jgi:hypothetical protein
LAATSLPVLRWIEAAANGPSISCLAAQIGHIH